MILIKTIIFTQHILYFLARISAFWKCTKISCPWHQYKLKYEKKKMFKHICLNHFWAAEISLYEFTFSKLAYLDSLNLKNYVKKNCLYDIFMQKSLKLLTNYLRILKKSKIRSGFCLPQFLNLLVFNPF